MDERALRAIDDFVVDLVNTRKFLQFYPSNNSRVRESLIRVYKKFRHLVEGGSGEPAAAPNGLKFAVERKHLYLGSHEVGRGFGPVSRFATSLYRVRVKTVQILPEATRVDLQAFLDASCLKPEAVRREGGFQHVLDGAHVRGIRIAGPDQITVTAEEEPEETLNGSGGVDMLGYLRSAQALRRMDTPEDESLSTDEEHMADLTELTSFFSEIMTGSEEKMTYFMETLADPTRLREALEHIYAVDAARNDGTGDKKSMELLRKSFSQMLNNIRGFSPDVREEYARNIGLAIIGAPPDVQTSLVQDGLASEVGKNEIADAVLSIMPDADVAESLLYAIRFHDGTASTISNFLDEFGNDPRRRAAIARLLTRLSSDDDSQAVAQLLDLLGTAGETHVSAADSAEEPPDFDHSEQVVLSRLIDLDDDELDRIEARVETDFHLRTPYHAARAILELYVQPTIEGVSKHTSARLNQQLLEILEDGGYDYLAEIVRVVETELPTSVQGRVKPQIEPALEECAYPQHINRILSKMRRAGLRSFEYTQLLYLLDFLGERAVEHLFLRLEMERSRNMRMFFLDIFRALGDKVMPVLNRKLNHRDWYVVRNVVYIFGSLGTDEAVHSLILLLDHKDMRVRREVVRALARVRGPVAEHALVQLLDDHEPAMRRLAAEWLGFVGCTTALPEIRQRLARADDDQLDFDSLIGLVRALGRLGNGPDDASLIKKIAPRWALLRGEKQRELSRAGKEALARLQGQSVPAGV